MADQKTLWDYVSEENLEKRLGSYRPPQVKKTLTAHELKRGRKGMLTPEEIKLLIANPKFLELLEPYRPPTYTDKRKVKAETPLLSGIIDMRTGYDKDTTPAIADLRKYHTPSALDFPILAGIPKEGVGSAYIDRAHIERLISNIILNRGKIPEKTVTVNDVDPDRRGEGEIVTNIQKEADKEIGTVLKEIGSGKQGPAEEGIARGIDWGALIDIAIGLPGAERSQGFSSDVPSAIAQSAQEVYGARAAAAQKEQENMLELYKEKLKNQPGFPKVGAETTRLYTQLGNYKRGLGLIKRLKDIMSAGIGPTGGPGKGLNAIRNIASLFGVNLGETASGKLDLAAAELRKQLIASRVFGREANRTEQKLIKALVPMSGMFTNIDQLDEAYNALKEEMIRQANEVSSIMTNVYGLKPYDDVIFKTPTPSGDNIYKRPNSTEPKKIGNQ